MDRSARRLPARERRDDVLLKGTAVLRDRRTIPVEVHNLSCRGCRIATDEVLAAEESIRLDVPPLSGIAAVVRWYADDFAGLSFRKGDWT